MWSAGGEDAGNIFDAFNSLSGLEKTWDNMNIRIQSLVTKVPCTVLTQPCTTMESILLVAKEKMAKGGELLGNMCIILALYRPLHAGALEDLG